MKLSEILNGIEIKSQTAAPDMEITEICYDSRAVTPGSLFVAIPGVAVDGHRFIPMAIEKGAAAILCEKTESVAAP